MQRRVRTDTVVTPGSVLAAESGAPNECGASGIAYTVQPFELLCECSQQEQEQPGLSDLRGIRRYNKIGCHSLNLGGPKLNSGTETEADGIRGRYTQQMTSVMRTFA